MLQVLILSNHSGGLYDFRKDLIAELKQYAQVTAAVPRNDRWEDLQALADHVIELPLDRRGMNPLHDGKLFRQYRAMLRQVRPDLVLTYTIKPNIYGGLACRMARVPYAAIENTANRDTLTAAGVVPKGRDVVLHGAGVNLEDYPCQPYPQEGPIRFLFVGRVMREKGVDELFAAAGRIKRDWGDRVEFCIAGSFEEAYKSRMDQLEQAGIVRYLGYRSDMRAVYRTAGCVVLPSYHEGMSNVLLEAAASGRPLITSDIPGCREAVEDGVSGYLCPAQNADALTAALARFAALPASDRAEMGRRGRARMERLFSKRTVVAETIQHLGIVHD